MDWSSSLNIKVSEVQGRVPITILHVDGRINLGNTGVLEQAAQEAYERGARDILLDLDNVPSLTSAGLRTIHGIYNMVSQSPQADEPAQGALAESSSQRSKSPHIKLFTTSPHVLKVLHVAGFDLYIDTYQDQNEAIAAF
jgi:anti-anti-sigma factor